MQITTRACHSTLALLEVARGGPADPVSVKTIARRHAIPERHLKILFKQLRGAGLVRGVCGAAGGYVLARAPEDTSLLDIVSAVGESPRAVEWVDDRRSRRDRPWWAPRGAWTRLEDAMTAMFDSISLADLSDAPGGHLRHAIGFCLEQ